MFLPSHRICKTVHIGIGRLHPGLGQREINALEHPVVGFGNVVLSPGIMGRAVGEKEGKRLAGGGFFPDKRHGHICLDIGFIAVNPDPLRFISEVKGLVVLMVEVVGGPVIIKTQPVFVFVWRHIRAFHLLMVSSPVGPEMPFADITCLITVLRKNMAETPVMGIHPQFIDDHSCRAGIFSREQRSTVCGADRRVGYGIGEVGAACGQSIDIGSSGFFIAHVANRLGPELVGKNIDQIRSSSTCKKGFSAAYIRSGKSQTRRSYSQLLQKGAPFHGLYSPQIFTFMQCLPWRLFQQFALYAASK